MFEFAALTYGLLASIILSSAQRNLRQKKPHPPLLLYVGYLLMGVSIGIALGLGWMLVSQTLAV